MDKLLLPLRYHCYWVCVITLEKAIKRFLESVYISLLLIHCCITVSTAAFSTFLFVSTSKWNIVQWYFWKWKAATMLNIFTWTLHKPADSTLKYFRFIISSMEGWEMCETLPPGSLLIQTLWQEVRTPAGPAGTFIHSAIHWPGSVNTQDKLYAGFTCFFYHFASPKVKSVLLSIHTHNKTLPS